jgi:hypothetical protein
MVSDKLALPEVEPSLAMTVSGYVPAAAVPASNVTLPVFPDAGDTIVSVAPVGRPETVIVTLPTLPVRAKVKFSVVEGWP